MLGHTQGHARAVMALSCRERWATGGGALTSPSLQPTARAVDLGLTTDLSCNLETPSSQPLLGRGWTVAGPWLDG